MSSPAPRATRAGHSRNSSSSSTTRGMRPRGLFRQPRATRVGGGVVMLRVIETEDQNQQWLGVADIMRAEAKRPPTRRSTALPARANGVAGITPERVIREGDRPRRSSTLIDEDDDISMLVLAAGAGAEGPGPAGHAPRARPAGASRFRSPSCPATSRDDEIDALSHEPGHAQSPPKACRFQPLDRVLSRRAIC